MSPPHIVRERELLADGLRHADAAETELFAISGAVLTAEAERTLDEARNLVQDLRTLLANHLRRIGGAK